MPGVFCAVGDVGPSRAEPATIFGSTGRVLAAADGAFCQLEINLTERGMRLPQARHTDRAHPRAASAIRDAGFSVVSWAGNHCMDWGTEGFFDTIAALRGAGLAVVGAGADLAEARRPVFVDLGGTRLAVLAYCSILPMGYWAQDDRPGCAPLRAFTLYEQIEHDQPGTPPRTHTFAHREDLAHLVADVAAAKEQADLVAVSVHWGIHFVRASIADYQREAAHAAIDAGADVILGHHAHILKGIELYRGRPIFYSLGNFAMDLHMTPEHAESAGFLEVQQLSPEWVVDFESSYNFPPDSRHTIIVKLEVDGGALTRCTFLPAFIGPDSVPEVLEGSDPRFAGVVDYLHRVGLHAGLDTQLMADGSEVHLAIA